MTSDLQDIPDEISRGRDIQDAIAAHEEATEKDREFALKLQQMLLRMSQAANGDLSGSNKDLREKNFALRKENERLEATVLRRNNDVGVRTTIITEAKEALGGRTSEMLSQAARRVVAGRDEAQAILKGLHGIVGTTEKEEIARFVQILVDDRDCAKEALGCPGYRRIGGHAKVYAREHAVAVKDLGLLQSSLDERKQMHSDAVEAVRVATNEHDKLKRKADRLQTAFDKEHDALVERCQMVGELERERDLWRGDYERTQMRLSECEGVLALREDQCKQAVADCAEREKPSGKRMIARFTDCYMGSFGFRVTLEGEGGGWLGRFIDSKVSVIVCEIEEDDDERQAEHQQRCDDDAALHDDPAPESPEPTEIDDVFKRGVWAVLNETSGIVLHNCELPMLVGTETEAKRMKASYARDWPDQVYKVILVSGTVREIEEGKDEPEPTVLEDVAETGKQCIDALAHEAGVRRDTFQGRR